MMFLSIFENSMFHRNLCLKWGHEVILHATWTTIINYNYHFNVNVPSKINQPFIVIIKLETKEKKWYFITNTHIR